MPVEFLTDEQAAKYAAYAGAPARTELERLCGGVDNRVASHAQPTVQRPKSSTGDEQ
ncbi:hypothetical protein GCM10009864_41080 [Streptomyces lunalinharesii]|uniref:Uncharacterized protein n=1 Tax=Streptomyces lunalinharesii TaxID=333384 RepID=A0ABP6EFL9_9ACTN